MSAPDQPDQPDTADGPDPDLPPLTLAGAAELRRLACAEFARHGETLRAEPDHLVAEDGRTLPLDPLAREIAARDPADWPDVVAHHVGVVLASRSRDLDAMADEEILDRAYLRLTADESLIGVSGLGYTRPVAPGLRELVAVDFPDALLYAGDDVVERVGLDRLREAGRRHLVDEPVDVVRRMEGPDGATVEIAWGESGHLASKVLVMEDLLQRVYGEREYPNGVLVGVPNRHQVLLHPVDDARVQHALGPLADLTRREWQAGTGPVSPYLHWWSGSHAAGERPGAPLLWPAGRAGPDGDIVITVPPDLATVLRGFGLAVADPEV